MLESSVTTRGTGIIVFHPDAFGPYPRYTCAEGDNGGRVVRLLSPPDRKPGDGEGPPPIAGGGRANRRRLYGKLVRKKERS